jgi:hypothetical protein
MHDQVPCTLVRPIVAAHMEKHKLAPWSFAIRARVTERTIKRLFDDGTISVASADRLITACGDPSVWWTTPLRNYYR